MRPSRSPRHALVAVSLLGCLHCGTPVDPADLGATGGTPNSPSGGTESGSGGETTTDTGGTSASGGSPSLGGGAADGGTTGSGGDSGGLVGGEPVAGDTCAFNVHYEQSSAIGTVTIVRWGTDLSELTAAHIEFGPAGAAFAMSAPVELGRADYRTLLLGMKPAREYGFRIVATGTAGSCTSADLAVTTGPAPAVPNLPVLTKVEGQAGGVQGFYVTSPGIWTTVDRGLPGAYIFDTDGDLVWWNPETIEDISSAQLSWDGQAMWYADSNGAPLYRTTMDGLSTEKFDIGQANHDVAPLPEGGVATFVQNDDGDALVEVTDDGTVSVIAQLSELYAPKSATFHPNALVYHEHDDTFTISDRQLDGFVKVTRLGQLLWQLGGEDPLGNSFELIGVTRARGHGHDLGPNGEFLYFDNAYDEGASLVVELALDEGMWTAEKTWEYVLDSECRFLGGTQRLPNGNTSVVHSMAGIISEVTPAGGLVQSFDNSVSFASGDGKYAIFGYARFRPTLYGPPASYWPD